MSCLSLQCHAPRVLYIRPVINACIAAVKGLLNSNLPCRTCPVKLPHNCTRSPVYLSLNNMTHKSCSLCLHSCCQGQCQQQLVMQRMSYDTFIQLYEKPRIPVVITGLQDSWQAQQLWNTKDLARRFGEHKFKVNRPPFHSPNCCRISIIVF